MQRTLVKVWELATVDGVQQPAVEFAYPAVIYDGGRALSKRPKQKNDCTVRALAIARGLAYDEAYDILAEAGRKCTRGFNMPNWLNKQPWATKMPFQATKGERRMNPASFCKMYQTGRYICRVSKHVFAVIDGEVYDAFENNPTRCIYTAWKIDIK